jgi:hypothetical protein
MAPVSTKQDSSISRPKQWFRRNRVEAIALVLGGIAINLILFASAYHGDHIDPAKAGVFGDFVGGYFGPIFALIGIILLIRTLKTERASTEKEAFESRFFELLKMHRDNVEEIHLGNASGRKVFVLIVREWRELLEIIKKLAQESNQDLSQRQILEITYCSLFFGTGPNSSRMLNHSLPQSIDLDFKRSLLERLEKEDLKLNIKKKRKFHYKPFEGHQSRLGHYYRHLYQLVRYVDENDLHEKRFKQGIGKKPEESKYEYMKTIRAQLSTHEQALLLLNSLSYMGGDWWNKHLIDRHKMVQNIPAQFFLKDELPVDELFAHDYWESNTAVPYVMEVLETPFSG